ncbi:hypothetical protein ACWGN5_38505 [Streptomyces sp. NPDC055815]
MSSVNDEERRAAAAAMEAARRAAQDALIKAQEAQARLVEAVQQAGGVR